MADCRCKYTYEDDAFAKRHIWTCIGPLGALHLHISEYSEKDHEASGGIEVHYRHPPDYMQDKAPSQDECWLLKCPCWHDGSSMAASDRWIPLWQGAPNDHDGIFRALRSEVASRFNDVGFLGHLHGLRVAADA